MKILLLSLTLAILLSGTHSSFAEEASGPAPTQACPNDAVKNPGVLTVDCDVLVPSKSHKVKKVHYQVSADDLVGGFNIEIPVTVEDPQRYSVQAFEYNVTATNSSNDCSFPASQQLLLNLEQLRPFCNPPALQGDTVYHQTCAFPEDADEISSSDAKPAIDGSKLKIAAKNSNLSVQCTAVFNTTSAH